MVDLSSNRARRLNHDLGEDLEPTSRRRHISPTDPVLVPVVLAALRSTSSPRSRRLDPLFRPNYGPLQRHLSLDRPIATGGSSRPCLSGWHLLHGALHIVSNHKRVA